MICVEIRRFQQLYAAYKMTGDMPKLKKERRPKSELTEEDKLLIGKALRERRLNGAVKIRLYIDKYYHKKLPYGKIHKYLLSSGISKLDKKKQKQRKYCKYQREHSFSLGHMDWHESKVIEGKWVCAWEDDASRKQMEKKKDGSGLIMKKGMNLRDSGNLWIGTITQSI